MELSHEQIVAFLQISIPPSIHIEKAVLIPSNKSKKDRARLYYQVSEGNFKQKEKNITGLVDELSFLEAVSEALVSIGCCRDTMETTEVLPQVFSTSNIASEALSQVDAHKTLSAATNRYCYPRMSEMKLMKLAYAYRHSSAVNLIMKT